MSFIQTKKAPDRNGSGLSFTYSALQKQPSPGLGAEEVGNFRYRRGDRLRALQDMVKGVGTQTQTTAGATQVRTLAPSYSIQRNEQLNKDIVKIDRNIFEGVDLKNRPKTLYQYLLSNLGGKEIITWTPSPSSGEIEDWGNASSVYIPKNSERINDHSVLGKLPYPGAKRTGNYNVRLRAASHVDELLKTSEFRNVGSDNKGKHGTFAEHGWEYRTAIMQDGEGNLYEVRLNIALGKEKNTLYDITHIKKIDVAMGQMQKASTKSTHQSFNNNVSQNGNAVNTSISKNPKNSTQNSMGDDFDTLIAKYSRAQEATQGTSALKLAGNQIAGQESRFPQKVNTQSKAQKYQSRQENQFLTAISKALSIPSQAQRNILKPVVSEIANAMKKGPLSEQAATRLFNQAYGNGVQVLDDYFNQYKPLRDSISGFFAR